MKIKKVRKPTRNSIIIAASDASDEDKARADYICDGIDDQVELQAAIDTACSLGVSCHMIGTFNIKAMDQSHSTENIKEGNCRNRLRDQN